MTFGCALAWRFTALAVTSWASLSRRDWSATCLEKFDETVCQKKWRSFKREGVTLRTLFKYAQQQGWSRNGASKFADDAHKRAERTTEAKGQTKSRKQVQAKLTRLSDVKPESVTWLWRGRIPFGKITIADGDPGLEKSLIATDLAARTSTAQAMPDGTASDLSEAAGVVLLSAEDDPADTIRPRLDAAGADCSRIILLSAIRDEEGERLLNLLDLEAVRAAIQEVKARLVVINPFMAYLPGKTDSHRDQDIRSALAPLAALAAETGVAVVVVVVRHLNKASGRNPLY